MSAFFKSIGNKLKGLAATINGDDLEPDITDIRHVKIEEVPGPQSEPQPKPEPKPEPQPEPQPQPQSQPLPQPLPQPQSQPLPQPLPQPQPVKELEKSEGEIFSNAIDKRNIAINAIVHSLGRATGSDLKLMREFHVFIIVESENYDIQEYAWADDSMQQHLRRALDDAMLDNIGRDRMKINLIPADRLPSDAKPVIDNIIYYSFRQAVQRNKTVRGRITVIEGTGSLMKEEYILDSSKKSVYYIGRGPMANKPGAIRPNDIVISVSDPDAAIQARNNHVSSAHAEISAANGEFYFRALKWGCAATGGASSKLIFDSAEHTVMDTRMKHRLNDGYIIKLGKEVCLLFNKLPD